MTTDGSDLSLEKINGNELKEIEQRYWQNYLATQAGQKVPKEPKVVAAWAGSKEITDELLKLYLSGKKVAGSSLVEDFITSGDPLPQVGNYWIFLNIENSNVVTEFFKLVYAESFGEPIGE
jgi:uncharacterized protein YhfF